MPKRPDNIIASQGTTEVSKQSKTDSSASMQKASPKSFTFSEQDQVTSKNNSQGLSQEQLEKQLKFFKDKLDKKEYNQRLANMQTELSTKIYSTEEERQAANQVIESFKHPHSPLEKLVQSIRNPISPNLVKQAVNIWKSSTTPSPNQSNIKSPIKSPQEKDQGRGGRG